MSIRHTASRWIAAPSQTIAYRLIGPSVGRWVRLYQSLDPSLTSEIAAVNQELEDVFGPSNQEGFEASSAPSVDPPSATAGWQLPTKVASSSCAAESHTAREMTQYAHSNTPPAVAAPGLSHVDVDGRASMVDISQKTSTCRTASASAEVLLGHTAFQLVSANQLKKGDVLAVAQLAGIMAAKHTSTLVPLCHAIPLSKVDVKLRLNPDRNSIDVSSSATTVGQTGVEMEALTAASVAALTVYDMCKAVSKSIVIEHIRLEHKSGGKSGDYNR